MKVFSLSSELIIYCESNFPEGEVAFIPTMGALHEGHATLMNKARKRHKIVIVSIFVNPTQFNDAKDFEKYPRTTEADLKICESELVDIVYLPNKYDVYPDGLNTKLILDLEGFDKVMEGEFRPGHFEGVCEVVKRLLDLTKPNFLFMGQKDFQQFMIVGKMIKDLDIKTELVVCKTSRTRSGLARSSRNTRLSEEGIRKASAIYRTLLSIKKLSEIKSIEDIEVYAMKRLNTAGFKTEYIQIIDGNTLRPPAVINSSTCLVVCVAAWLEDVRLIDNLVIKNGDLKLI